jgi:PAS domain S-box-containing protein
MNSTGQSRDNRASRKDGEGKAEQGKPDDAKRKFRMSEGRFRLAFEKAPIGLAIVDTNYQFRRVNAALCEALGYDESELIGRSFVEITHPDDVRTDTTLADKLFKGEISSYRLEKRFVTKRGDLAWLDLTALCIREEGGAPLYGLAMVENITERRRTQEALRTSEERYRSFVVNSSEGIWRLEIEQPIDTKLPPDEQIGLFYKYGYLAECNDALARMYGHQRADDIVGSRFGEFGLASHPASVASMRKLINSAYRLVGLETEEFDANGAKKYFSTNLIGIVINNILLRIWGVQSDRTQQRTAELELEHSHQQLRSLSAYLQSVREKERTDLAREIHDTLGQALTGIKIELSLLNKKLKFDKAVNLSLLSQKLDEIGQSVTDTIASVKTLSTELRPGVLDKFGLAAAIEWQCEEFTQRFKIHCQCNVPRKELSLPSRLSTALFRILQEALTNVAQHSEADVVQVNLSADKKNVSLVISDNGKGITLEELNAPTSLGLLGMSERAGCLKGTFSVKGKPDHGTVVNVRIPLSGNQDVENKND